MRDLVYRAAPRAGLQPTVGQDARGGLAVRAEIQRGARPQEPAFEQRAEGNAREGARIERGKRGGRKDRRRLTRETPPGEGDVGRLTLDADPVPAQAARGDAGRAGAKKWIEHDLAQARTGQLARGR
ncbi:MAG: hypothetical protein NTY23_07950, partial [Chloroflexi bacterium]|nr:hypothetical protein [Chloroflexota bacterium]